MMRRKGTAHLAGIIPVEQGTSKFKMDWHDSLTPIAPGYTAIEHSVYECAMAGCHTIWISAAEDVTPLIRRRIGGIYDVKILRQHRASIISEDNILLSANNLTIRDGSHLGFTFGIEELIACEGIFEKMYNNNLFEDQKNEDFSLDRIFSGVILKESEQVELPFYYSIEDWEGYCNYLSSAYSKELKHPGKLVISYREWNPIGTNN
jgi:hypothetical protein